MRFKRILVFGINRISKKKLQLKNYNNIDKILEYIKNYRKENGKLSLGLRNIKTLLFMKTPGLIRIFVKSKDFENYKKEEKSIVFRNGLLKEEEKIDIFKEEGILSLFSPIKDNLKSKRKITGVFRKCFHAHPMLKKNNKDEFYCIMAKVKTKWSLSSTGTSPTPHWLGAIVSVRNLLPSST